MRNLATQIRGHTQRWYERLATLQQGYFYPWGSTIDEGGGEAAYTDMVRRHLSPACDVLEAGCGHGVDAIAFAPLCHSLRGYDQVDRFVVLARQAAAEHSITNTTFLCRNSSADRNGGQVTVPALSDSIDLVISRRGPTNWIEDVRRFCRPGAVLLQLQPLAELAEYRWNSHLPDGLRQDSSDAGGDAGSRQTVEARLAKVGLHLHSWWIYDVAEWLHTPRDLYHLLTFGNAPEEVPSWRESEPQLTRIFERHAVAAGLELRNRRFLWKAILHAEPSPLRTCSPTS